VYKPRPRALHTAACPLDQQRAQVAITATGDRAQARLAAAAVLGRREAKPRSELAAVAKVATIADGGDQCVGGERADAGHGLQAATARISARLRNGVTNCAAISLGASPCSRQRRAQWCAPLCAAMATTLPAGC